MSQSQTRRRRFLSIYFHMEVKKKKDGERERERKVQLQQNLLKSHKEKSIKEKRLWGTHEALEWGRIGSFVYRFFSFFFVKPEPEPVDFNSAKLQTLSTIHLCSNIDFQSRGTSMSGSSTTTRKVLFFICGFNSHNSWFDVFFFLNFN